MTDGRILDDLDPVDVEIIRMLQEQGRRTNAEIARRLAVSEPTIRKRIDRLFGEGIIKVVAVLNPRKTGFDTDVLVGIKVQPGNLVQVGKALAERDDVVYLGYTTGRHDILAEMLFRNEDELFEFLKDELPAIGAIVSSETYTVLRAEKINYDWKLPSEFAGRKPSSGREGVVPM